MTDYDEMNPFMLEIGIADESVERFRQRLVDWFNQYHDNNTPTRRGAYE